MTASSPRHEMEMYVKLGAMKDGTIQMCIRDRVLPCNDPKQRIHPHWQDENQYDKAGLIDAKSSQDHSQRVCENQADNRTDKG